MKTTKLLHLILSILLINISSAGLCLADGKGKQTVVSQDEVTLIKQQVEELATKNKVRIRLKSDEKIIGRILASNHDFVSVQTGKENNKKTREISYYEIKTIQAEEKLSPGIKVLGVVVTAAIVVIFAVVTHHRQR
jgi:hypothetical protein